MDRARSMSKNLETRTIKTPPMATVINEIAKKERPFFFILAIKLGPAMRPIGARKSTRPRLAKNFGTSNPK